MIGHPVIYPLEWRADWAWGLPLIVLTVVIHVVGFVLVWERVTRICGGIMERRYPKIVFMLVLGVTTLLATCLHGIEAYIWAVAFLRLGALPNLKSSVLYSLNAITSYGHINEDLEEHWRLMGAMEALNGWLLFGLTTAFLFAVIEKVWTFDRTSRLLKPNDKQEAAVRQNIVT